ncbi:DUF4333 domain-containing protein [Nocardiopsis sp. RSe5-2]|uniref:DUF4333 domain-containing protein n=1 Tax=Nocardiopsis endophytica TaxID=3018445 RepID=A0ABT4U1N4_9ACTN|nr:DUF4333 domain-containing protein [Nocardiopsis endophytica]MDA2810864.1 DUF4333 domain-containing protein [Nocardiopsis endophytica]
MAGTVGRRVAAAGGLGALAVLLSAGCSFNASVGDMEPVGSPDAEQESGGDGGGAESPEAGGGDAGAVPADEVARQASDTLAETVGQTPDSLTCPEDLPAEVGASIRCELTADGQTLGVTVTATAVEGTNVDFDVVVDETPMG